MPVTAKLSRAFYEKLGDDIANELVAWFNDVDLSYRTQLREINDLNFARFDARVGERLAELRAEMETRFARIDERISGLGGRLDGLVQAYDARFAALEARLDRVDVRLDRVEARLDNMDAQIKDLAVRIEALRASLIKYLFTFWLGTGLMVIGWFVTRWLVMR